MKKHTAILYALLILALAVIASPATAQTVLTVNGVCVPTTCGSTPPPPTCTGGQILQGNVCVCPAGTWNGSVCVISPPPSGNYEIREINWASGNSYVGKLIQNVVGGTVAAYRINAVQFLSNPSQTPGTARIEFYESGSVTVCVSNTPGAFLPPGGLTPCFSVTGPNGKTGVQLAGPDFGASDATLSQYGWKRLPPATDGYYYVNVKLPDPNNLPSTFWLLFN